MALPPGFIKPVYKNVSDLNGGLNVGMPADHIEDNQAQAIQNLVYLNGVLQVDTGFTQYGYRVAGFPLEVIEQELTTGTLINVLITTVAFYQWNPSISDWVLAMTPYLTTTSSGSTGTPWTDDFNQYFGPTIEQGNLGTGSLTGVAVGDVVSIACTNGRFFTSTVTSVNTGAGTVAYADNLLPGYVIAPGAQTKFYKPYHGGEFGISWVIDPTLNSLIWTNGVDPVQSFVGGTNEPLMGLYGNPTADPVVPPIATTARLVARFYGYTIAIGTTEGGAYLPYRFRYSTPVSSTDWTDSAAGYNDLTDTADAITSVALVSSYLVLGRESSIMRVSYWGTAIATWFFEYSIPTTGVLGNNALARTREASMLVSEPGIFFYAADYNLTEVGQNVYNLVLGPNGNLDPKNDDNLFIFYVNQLDEMWFFYPSVGNTYCDTLLRFSLKYKNWHVRKFQSQMSGIGVAYNSNSRTWAQAIGTWLEQVGPWVQRSSAGTFPFLVFAAYFDRVTYKYDYQAQTDCLYDPTTGIATQVIISWFYVSKDYPVLDQKLILDGINVYAQGTCLFEVSPDSGVTWKTLGTLSFGTSLSKKLLDFQLTSDLFRFRFSGTDPTFQMADYSVRYLEASEY
jgi:hypothetical protein